MDDNYKNTPDIYPKCNGKIKITNAGFWSGEDDPVHRLEAGLLTESANNVIQYSLRHRFRQVNQNGLKLILKENNFYIGS